PQICGIEVSGSICTGMPGFWGGGVNMNDRHSPTPGSVSGGNSGREIVDYTFNSSRTYWAIYRGIQYTDSNGDEHAYFWWDKIWSTAYSFSSNSFVNPAGGDQKPGGGGGNGGGGSKGPAASPSKGYWARFVECMNDFRFDNLVRDIGRSLGHPGIGDLAADLTITGTVAAVANQGLNLTSLGRYPRGGISGTPAGSP